MKFISILPISQMDEQFNQYTVMLLAHLSKKYPEYAKRAAEYDGYKIMDNSIIEIGEAFTMESLIEEAIKCDVQEIILPDVFNNGQATVKKVKESIEWLRENGYLGRFKLMAVCHGSNKYELDCTFKTLENIPEIDVIGLPKVLSTWLGFRIDKANEFAKQTNKEIHLLGCWDSLEEYKNANLSLIRSTDTCMPSLLTKYGMNVWDWRNGRKFDLEKDNIDLGKYKSLMKEFYENCCL